MYLCILYRNILKCETLELTEQNKNYLFFCIFANEITTKKTIYRKKKKEDK